MRQDLFDLHQFPARIISRCLSASPNSSESPYLSAQVGPLSGKQILSTLTPGNYSDAGKLNQFNQQGVLGGMGQGTGQIRTG